MILAKPAPTSSFFLEISAVIGSTAVLTPTREWISDAAEVRSEERRPRMMGLLAPARAIDFAIERQILIPPLVRTTVLPARERDRLVGVIERFEVKCQVWVGGGNWPVVFGESELVWNLVVLAAIIECDRCQSCWMKLI